MTSDELLKSVQSLPQTKKGLQILRSAVSENGDIGFLKHSSQSDNTLGYFQALRHEVHDLFCSSRGKYSEQRKQLKQGGIVLVSFLAGIVSTKLGAPTGLATPLAAAALFIPLKMGISAWCRVYQLSPNEVTPDELAAADKPRPNRKRKR
jgi:hypothetical protein